MNNTNPLFRAFTHPKLHLPNRIAMAPMTRTMSPGCVVNDKSVEYYRRRAAGGVGLIITEGTCISHKGASMADNIPAIHGEEALAGWAKVVDAVHGEGGKIAAQLWHVGAIRKAGMGPDPEVPGYGPSGMAVPGKPNREVMTQADIDETVASYGQAAADAKAAGFDAVEIHGAHGYLIDQFLWEGTNVRTDAYGGSAEKRWRFAVEVTAAVRAAVGEEYPLIFRWSQWKQQNYDARLFDSPKAMKPFLVALAEAGVDIFHCSARRFWEPEFEGSEMNLAGWVRQLSGVPTITVGSVGLNADFLPKPEGVDEATADTGNIEALCERLAADEFDLVAVGRALIANPEWANQVEAGRLDELLTFDKKMLMSLN